MPPSVWPVFALSLITLSCLCFRGGRVVVCPPRVSHLPDDGYFIDSTRKLMDASHFYDSLREEYYGRG